MWFLQIVFSRDQMGISLEI